MINMSTLCKWTRIGRLGLHERKNLINTGDKIIATQTSYDEKANQTLSTVTYGEEDLKTAVKECRLATSDDILYLISPWDVVEIRSPNGKGAYNSVRTNAEPSEDGDLSDFHEEIAKLYANPASSGYPEGSYASTIFAAPGDDPTEPLVVLAYRNGPDEDWVAGPKEVKKRVAGSMSDDLFLNPPF